MKMIFDLDMERCVACGACAVACMDQNDLHPEEGEALFRTVGILEPLPGSRKLGYLSLGCMHCSNAPCITACPTGCLYKNELGLTVYDNSRCIGCHSCAMACPFGAPTFTAVGIMRKCDGCHVRQQSGLEPACVRICPTGALTCRAETEYLSEKRTASMREALARE